MHCLTRNGKLLMTADHKAIGMNTLLVKANTATGKSDKTLDEAIDSLIEKIGQTAPVSKLNIGVESYSDGNVKLKFM